MANWIGYALDNKYIQLYPYESFGNVRYNGDSGGTGRFGEVARAEWPRSNRKVALKKLKNFNMDKFVSEIRMHVLCHSSKNIVRFLGVTREEETEFVMVFEYADRNNLRMFLKSTPKLEWVDRIRLSLDIAKGLDYLHFLNIAHRDLHSNNIVISQVHRCEQPEFTAKITDFGSAIAMDDYENDVRDEADVIGQIPFTDPRCLNDPKHYRKDLRSDIYSLGVIFWEISSSRVPFENFMPDSWGAFRELCLTFEIISEFRERQVLLTPEKFVKLYKRCWRDDPAERYNIQEVIEILDLIISGLSKSLEQTGDNG